ncbi:MAG: leukotoxin LktA family filamentous adhesin [Planctomycetaceae bacterium]|jgi:hypothetical protein|nr:leukotoxin LktA family filamentous adhesin [Planctomycetaceae bacterium]
MNFNKFVCEFFKSVVVFLTSISLVFQAPLLTYLYAQSPAAIIPDGRTQTSITGNGNITDVHTKTINGRNAYNSFERFNVPSGNTTNLHVPDTAKNLVNLVHKERSQIDGILNSYKNGKIGGNVFFLNPHGIVIGQGGIVNVGSLHLQTPTQDYLNNLLSQHGVVSAVHEQQLFEGKVPISPSGVITVKGKINAVEEVQIKAGDVDIAQGSRVRAGREVVVEFGDLVNIEGLNWGNDLVVTPEGKIKIVATNNVEVAGEVKVDGIENNKAGNIEIKADNNINVRQNAEISAKGNGKNSDGGEIIIYADNNSTLEKNANIDVSAEPNAKGGFLKFSASENVNISENGLHSSSGGKILIDTYALSWKGEGDNVFTKGADLEIEAYSKIYIENVYISSRNISTNNNDYTREKILTEASIGDSGNIVIHTQAPSTVTIDVPIEIKNSQILSFATGQYNAGNIKFENESAGIGGSLSMSNVIVNSSTEKGWGGSINLKGLIYVSLEDSQFLINSKDAGRSGNFTYEYSGSPLDILSFSMVDTTIDVSTNGIGGKAGSIKMEKLRQFSMVNSHLLSLANGTSAYAGSIDIGASNYIELDFLGLDTATHTMTMQESTIEIGGTSLNAFNRYGEENEPKILIGLSNNGSFNKLYMNESSKIIAATTSGTPDDPSDDKFGDISINIEDNAYGDQFDYVGNTTAEFKMSEQSEITGKNIAIQALAGSGVRFEVKQDGSLEETESDGMFESLEGLMNTSLGVLESLFELAVSTVGSIGATARFNQSNVKINIDGTIKASEDIKIAALAESKADFINLSIVIAGSAACVSANSEVTIGGKGSLIADNGSVSILSQTKTTISTLSATMFASPAPFDLHFAAGVAISNNKINIKEGALIQAKDDIIIQALTERTHGVSSFGGAGNSYVGLTAVVLYGNAQTDVIVEGDLIAGNKISLEAKTDTIKNSINSKISMGGTAALGGIQNTGIKLLDKVTGLVTKIKNLISKIVEKIKPSDGSPSNPFDQIGVSGAFGVLFDSIDTHVTVNSSAKLTAKDISINSETKNKIVVTVGATISDYEVDDKKVKKDIGLAIAVPIILMDNNTSSIVKSGAELKSNGDINITSSNKIPYNLNHPIYNLITDPGIGTAFGLLGMIQNNLGIDNGLFNTWSQSSTLTDELSLGGMVDFLIIENTTKSIIEDGVTIGGIDGISTKPNLTVTADTVIELGNLVGHFTVFWDGTPDFTKGSWRDWTDALDFVPEIGNETGGSALGAAFLGSFVTNTTIARIDGATIDVSDLIVQADTRAVDIGISIGGGKAGGIGIEGMIGLSYYNSYTLAKIDDGASVKASSVTIKAIDDAYRIGIAGGYVKGTTGIGVSAILTYSDRQAHAVWGNLLDDDGNLARIKGDDYYEKNADSVTNSIVTGNIDIESLLGGLNIVAAVAGTMTSQTGENNSDDKNYVENIVDPIISYFNGANKAVDSKLSNAKSKSAQQKDPQMGIGVSGAAAINILFERSTAGISGNVNIAANDIKLLAENSILDVSIGGSMTLQGGTEKPNVGIAGSFGLNILDGKTIAYIQPTSPYPDSKINITFNDLDIDAERTGKIISVTAGGSGTAAEKGAQVAGSASLNILLDDTIVRIKDAILTEKNEGNSDVNINAADSALIIALAGGFAAGGKGAAGASIVGNYLDLNTFANINNSKITANNLSITSDNKSSIVTIAFAGGAGKTVGVGGTIAILLSDGTTQTSIFDSEIILSGAFEAAATSDDGIGAGSYYRDIIADLQKEEDSGDTSYLSDNGTKLDTREKDADGNLSGEETALKLGLSLIQPKIVTAALAIALGETAVGANIGLNILTDTTGVLISGSKIAASAVGLDAATSGSIIAVGVGVSGSSGSLAIGGNVAVNLVGGSTTVDLINGSNIDVKNELSAKAINSAGIVNIAFNLAVSNGGTGVSASIAYNQIAHSTLVNVNNNVQISGGSIKLAADNTSAIIAALISIGGGGGTGGFGVSFAINTIGTIALSEIDSTDIDNLNDNGTREEEEKFRYDLASDFGSENIISKIASSENKTEVVIQDSTITATVDGIDLDANISGAVISIAIGAGFGGNAGAGAAGAYNNNSAANNIFAINSNLTTTGTRGDISAETLSSGNIFAVSIGGGGGGTVGVGVGAALNNLFGQNQIAFLNTNTISTGAISLDTRNNNLIISVAGGVAGGGTVGVGAAITANLLWGTTVAQIVGGITEAETISIKAFNNSDIFAVAGAGAFGGVFTAAGSIAVNYLQNKTDARIGQLGHTETIFKANEGINIDALADGNIISIGGMISISGGVGIAGSIATNVINSQTNTYIENANLIANESGNGNFHAFANSDNYIKNIIINVSGALYGTADVIIGMNVINGTTETKIDSADITAYTMDILAKNHSESLGITATMGLSGFASVAIVTDLHLLLQNVNTKISDSNLTALNTIEIDAIDSKTVMSNVAGLAGSVFVGVSGALTTVVTSGRTIVDIANTEITTTGYYGDIIIYSKNETILRETAASLGIAGIAGVAMTAGVNVILQEAQVNTDANTVLTAEGDEGDVEITGLSEFKQDWLLATSIGGGLVGVAGTVVVTTLADKVNVNIAGEIAAGHDVKLNALGVSTKLNSVVGGVAAGLVGGAAGLEVLVVNNGASLWNAANIVAGNDIILTSKQSRDITQKTSAGGAGVLGLAATVSVINMGGSIDEKNQDAFADSLTASNDMLTKQKAKTKRLEGISVDNAAVSKVETANTALLRVDGSLTAANKIIGVASVDNDVDNIVQGLGIGVAGAGAAIGIMHARDNITTNINADISAKEITFESIANQKRIKQDSIAGGGGIKGYGAALGVIDFSGDITTNIASGNAMIADKITISAYRDFAKVNIESDSAAVGAVGLSGAVAVVMLGDSADGKSAVNISDNTTILGKEITLSANDQFKNIYVNADAGSGGVLSGAGSDVTLIINNNSKINVGNNAFIGQKITESNYPKEGNSINLIANATLDKIYTNARMLTGGMYVGGTALNVTQINLNENIYTGQSELRSWDILFLSDQTTTDIIADAAALTTGIAAVAGVNSFLTVNENNNIQLENTTVDAWWDFIAKTGYGNNNLTTTAELINASAIPLSIYPFAKTILYRNDNIAISGSNANVQSVRNINLLAGDNNAFNNLKSHSKYTSWITSSDTAQEMFDPDQTSLSDKGSTIEKNLNSLITIDGAKLEAGSHYKQELEISPTGEITKSITFPDITTKKNVNVGTFFDSFVADKQNQYDNIVNKIDNLKKYSGTQDLIKDLQGTLASLQAELAFLKSQAAYYKNDDESGKTADMIYFLNDIVASNGDIILNAQNVTLNGDAKFIAHDAATISITNNSSAFLTFGNTGSKVNFLIPEQLGGRIFYNGNIIKDDNSFANYNMNADLILTGNRTYDSITSDNARLADITITNKYDGGINLASEIFVNNANFSNYQGSINFNSAGSTWFNDTNLNAKDITIKTDGVVYQGYSIGINNIAGDPFKSDNLETNLTLWKTSHKVTPTIEDVNAFQNAKDELYNKYLRSDGTADSKLYSELYNERLDALMAASTLESILKCLQDAGAKSKTEVAKFGNNDQVYIYHDASDGNKVKRAIIYEGKYYTVITGATWLDTTFEAITNSSNITFVRDYADAVQNSSLNLDTLVRLSDANESNFGSDKSWAETFNSRMTAGYASFAAEYKKLVTGTNNGVNYNNLTPDNAISSNGKMSAGRSIFISAEIINVNGLIESGWLNYNIDLNTNAVTDAIKNHNNQNILNLTDTVFTGTNSTNANYNAHKVEIKYDPVTNSIVLDNIKAEGGSITLYGNIISTGGGKLSVADGYGNVKINVNDNYQTTIGRIDTGNGAEGVITITDTSKKTNNINYLTTTYRRINGEVYYSDNKNSNVPISGAAVYKTTADRWLVNVDASHSVSANVIQQKQTTTLGQIFAFDWTPETTTTSYLNMKQFDVGGIELGEFLITDATLRSKDTSLANADVIGEYTKNTTTVTLWNDDNYSNYYNQLSDDAKTFVNTYAQQNNLTTSDPGADVTGWFGFIPTEWAKTRKYAEINDATEIWRVYVNASKDISINFFGNDTTGEIDITGKSTVTLTDLIRSSHNLNIRLESGDILSANTGKIESQNINLTAAKGNIGGIDAAPVNLTGGNYKTTIKASANNVNLDFKNAQVYVNEIKTIGGENSKLNFRSAGEILMALNGNGFDAAGFLNVVAEGGKITGVSDGDYFKMKAGNNVNINATSGIKAEFGSTLYAESIKSQGGNIDLKVNGDLLDSNSIEIADPLSDAERSEFWQSLGIVKNTTENTDLKTKIIAGYETSKTVEYFEFWNEFGKNAKEEIGIIDKDKNTIINSAESKDLVLNVEKFNNEYQTWVTNKTNGDEKLKAFYDEIATKQFDADYKYKATEEEKTQRIAGLDWNLKQLKNDLPANIFIQTADAGSRQNTTSMIEEPNIAGHNISLNVTGNIGTPASENITISKGDDLFPENADPNVKEIAKNKLRALADAELDDVTIVKNNDGTIKQLDIKRYDNFNIEATGTLKAQSANGWINIGIQGDITIDNSINDDSGIRAGTDGSQDLRLKVDGSIKTNNDKNIAINAKNAVIEAAGGQIGNEQNKPLVLKLTGTNENAWLTTRANDIYLNILNEIYVREISADNINIKAEAFHNADPTNTAVKINGTNINLNAATGSIGTKDNYLTIAQADGGTTQLYAANNIYAKNPTGSLDITNLNTEQDFNNQTRIISIIADQNISININAVNDYIVGIESISFETLKGDVTTGGQQFAVAGVNTILNMTSARDIIFSTSAFVTTKANLTAANDVIIKSGMFNSGTKDLTVKAGRDISIKANITGGKTSLETKTGKIEFDGKNDQNATINAKFNDLTLNSATDILISNLQGNDKFIGFDVTNNFTATAENEVIIKNVIADVGNTTITATNGNLEYNGGKATFNNSLTLNSNTDISIINLAEFIVTNNFNATAENNLIINSQKLSADEITLTAKTENLKINNGTAKFNNAKFTAGKNIELNDNIDITISGDKNNVDGNSLSVLANNNIVSNGKITVAKNDANLTAKDGEIISLNNNKTNIDAVNSNVNLIAAKGIGNKNSFELKAKTLSIDVTDAGNVSLNIIDDTTINNIKNTDGIIDINVQGSVVVGDVSANGNGSDFVLGATKNITFSENAKITADERIVIVSDGGDIYSESNNETNAVIFNAASNNIVAIKGKIHGKATQNNGGFITTFTKGKVNLISNEDLLVYETSQNEVDYDTVVSGGQISILSILDNGISIQKIVANKINFDQGIVKLSKVTDEYYADVASVIGEDIVKIISKNNSLFGKQFDIVVDEIVITNNKENAQFDMGVTEIRSKTNITIAWDKLIMEGLVAGVGSSFTHIGGSKEVADLTIVKNIASTGDFTFKNMASNLVYVYSDSINGVLQVLNSYNGNHANYDINNISLVIDSVDKGRSGYYSYFRQENMYPDFRVWSIDGSYDFDLTAEKLNYTNPQLRMLSAFNHNLILNNNVTYTDSAFDDLLVDKRCVTNNFIGNLLKSELRISADNFKNNTLANDNIDNIIRESWAPQSNSPINLDAALIRIDDKNELAEEKDDDNEMNNNDEKQNKE